MLLLLDIPPPLLLLPDPPSLLLLDPPSLDEAPSLDEPPSLLLPLDEPPSLLLPVVIPPSLLLPVVIPPSLDESVIGPSSLDEPVTGPPSLDVPSATGPVELSPVVPVASPTVPALELPESVAVVGGGVEVIPGVPVDVPESSVPCDDDAPSSAQATRSRLDRAMEKHVRMMRARPDEPPGIQTV